MLNYIFEKAKGANELSANGLEYINIPQIPIAEITTDVSWLYLAIAKYIIVPRYSTYDLISEIPVIGNETQKNVSKLKRILEKIEAHVGEENLFNSDVNELAAYLGYTMLLLRGQKAS